MPDYDLANALFGFTTYVMDERERCFNEGFDKGVTQERERCAKIAENEIVDDMKRRLKLQVSIENNAAINAIARTIATYIRSGCIPG
jgi:hypothetical protein